MNAVSQVSEERTVRCPFSVAHEYVVDFFRDIDARGAEVRLPLRSLVPSLSGHLRRPVQVSVGLRPDELETGRPHDVVEVSWTAGSSFFPDFHGDLRLRIASVDETVLTLEASYHPPFGPLGRAFDAVAGRRLARATMRDLLERLAGAMERREAAFRTVAS